VVNAGVIAAKRAYTNDRDIDGVVLIQMRAPCGKNNRLFSQVVHGSGRAKLRGSSRDASTTKEIPSANLLLRSARQEIHILLSSAICPP
jgi:hypothetical protein